MILGAYLALLTFSIGVFYLYFRGRTVEGVVRRPPEGSDLKLVVSNLSYIEHELIKHRVPVIRSLLGKGRWSDDDWDLLARTLGSGEASLVSELGGYFGGIQRGSGRTLVNFTRDRAFNLAHRQVQLIQKTGERWLRETPAPSPDEHERQRVERAAAWLAADFRKYLLELRRSVFRCLLTGGRLERSGRRGIMEAAREGELTFDVPPKDCIVNILPGDLDLVIRNLVRNATQASRPGGMSPLVHIDVEEIAEETGEESVLIRVHDNCPQLLTREQIYGREASRGLGLVTTALNRYQGAVRCIESDHEGMEKAMEVRLQRSLHEPDETAHAIGRHRSLSVTLPLAFVALHGLLITTVISTYLLAYPVRADHITLPEHCSASRESEHRANVLCEVLDEDRRLRTGSTVLGFGGPVFNGLALNVFGDTCLRTSLGPGEVIVDTSRCFSRGELHPSARLEVRSPWVRRAVDLDLSFRSTSSRLLEAVRSALHGDDFDTAATVLAFLSRDSTLSREEAFETKYWEGLQLILLAQSTPAGSRIDSNDYRCDWARDARAVRAQLHDLTWHQGQQVTQWYTRAYYLGAVINLWMWQDPANAALDLRAIADIEPADRAVQSARFLLLLLGAMEVGDIDKAEVANNLLRLEQSYRNPAIVAAGHSAELVLELPGVWLDIPIPEALCAFDRAFPEVSIGVAIEDLLAEYCGLRRPHQRLDHELAEIISSLRALGPPLACE